MTTADVLGHHLQAFGAGSLEEIMKDYTAESKFVTPDGVIEGLDGIRTALAGLFAEFGKPGMRFEMLKTHVVGEVALIVWNAETADNVYELGTDTFVVRGGKIAYQTFAAKVAPK